MTFSPPRPRFFRAGPRAGREPPNKCACGRTMAAYLTECSRCWNNRMFSKPEAEPEVEPEIVIIDPDEATLEERVQAIEEFIDHELLRRDIRLKALYEVMEIARR